MASNDMSVSLMFERLNGQQSDRLVPVSTEKIFYEYWYPVIEQEGYTWLQMMAGGFTVTAANVAEVLVELRQLQAVIPRYYDSSHDEYAYIMRRLALLIETLESLVGQEFEVFLG